MRSSFWMLVGFGCLIIAGCLYGSEEMMLHAIRAMRLGQ